MTIREQIEEFYKDNYKVKVIEGTGQVLAITIREGRSDRLIIIELKEKTIQTSKETSSYYIVPFNKVELKLFDSLGFDLSKKQKAFTNQNIEDWFK